MLLSAFVIMGIFEGTNCKPVVYCKMAIFAWPFFWQEPGNDFFQGIRIVLLCGSIVLPLSQKVRAPFSLY